MNVSQKCQYALRAVFELSKRPNDKPTPVSEIAAIQAIPPRFLEIILGQLKQGGFVESRRGARGGYILATPGGELTVGEIIRFVDGPVGPVDCVAVGRDGNCPLLGRCAFMGMWERARDAVTEVYDATTFQNLIEEEQVAAGEYVASYCI
jgi:Rrf2 family transcriptional regulator, cysteine metabolism repressor